MGDEHQPCQKCQTDINTDAEVCPSCGFDPQSDGRLMRKVFLVGGILLTASLIGAPIGIPMLLTYYIAVRNVREKRPTAC
jgi:hypothetical protein